MIRILFLIMVLFSSSALADREAPARPFTVFSNNKMYYVELNPKFEESFSNGNQGKALVYKSDSHKILWSVNWYGGCLITDDGQSLIAIGGWSRSEDMLGETALIFFENGKELNRYFVNDLIADKSKLARTVSHFNWRDYREGDGLSEDNAIFTVTSSDGVTHKFDVHLGVKIK